MVFLLGLLVFYRELLTVSEITQALNRLNKTAFKIFKTRQSIFIFCAFNSITFHELYQFNIWYAAWPL